MEKRETKQKPPHGAGTYGGSGSVSGILYLCGHLSGTAVSGGLERSTRGIPVPFGAGRIRVHGMRSAGRLSAPARPCTGRGLPGRRVSAPPVRSCRTISPLPRRLAAGFGCVFSVALSRGRPLRVLPGALPCGVPTFLRPFGPAAARPASIYIVQHCGNSVTRRAQNQRSPCRKSFFTSFRLESRSACPSSARRGPGRPRGSLRSAGRRERRRRNRRSFCSAASPRTRA